MKTILLVDDEYGLVETLTELLEEEGYRVVAAANGKDGLAKLKKESPALILTDYMMPIADGRELVRGLREVAEFRSTPVVMMSASSKAVALSDANGSIEVAAFLKKPFEWDKLIQVIIRLIGNGETKDAGDG